MGEFDINEIWSNCLKKIRGIFKESANFDFVLQDSNLKQLDPESGNAIVTVESEFIKTIIESEFYNQIKEVLNNVLNSDFKLIIMTNDEFNVFKNKKEISKEELDSLVIPNDSLDSKFLFENFIVSEGNKKLYSAALGVSFTPGKWNPLYIYGKSGLGKTHLMQAIGNEVWKKQRNKSIRYIEARDFGDIVQEAAKAENNLEAFSNIQKRFEKYDLLLVDDIQFIETWEKTREVFFNIFNYFINKGKQVVITSDQYPEDFREFEERIISRFKSGLVMPIIAPDVETYKKILNKTLENSGLNPKMITNEAIAYICMNLCKNIRDLQGVVNKIMIENLENNSEEKIDTEKIKDMFRGIVKNNKVMTVKKIVNEVARYFSIRPDDIFGVSRNAEIMKPRHISIFLSKTLLGLNLKELGKEFKRDHSTIISSLRKMDEERSNNISLSNEIVEIQKILT